MIENASHPGLLHDLICTLWSRACLSDLAAHMSTETLKDIPKPKTCSTQIWISKNAWLYLEGGEVGGFKAVLVTIDGADG